MVHFVSRRNPDDRGYYEHQVDIGLPADGELTREAGEFEVLAKQLELGGLIPGFPDAIQRRYSPRSAIVAQDVPRVDFSKRLSLCGVIFRRSEFEEAGAFKMVIHGRPDLQFEDLLAWDSDNASAEYIAFRNADFEIDRALGLSLHIPRSPFSSVGVMVDDDEQASIISDILTKRYLALRQYEPSFRYVRSQLKRIFIVVKRCSDRAPSHRPGILGLQGFERRAAVSPQADLLRCKVAVDSAIADARWVAGKYMERQDGTLWPDHCYRTMFIDFPLGADPISRFLDFTNGAMPVDDGVAPGRYRFELGIDSWCSPADQRFMFDEACAALEARLGLGFCVRSYAE
jgi:hypothetical protein